VQSVYAMLHSSHAAGNFPRDRQQAYLAGFQADAGAKLLRPIFVAPDAKAFF
jgi:hypothetical protein